MKEDGDEAPGREGTGELRLVGVGGMKPAGGDWDAAIVWAADVGW